MSDSAFRGTRYGVGLLSCFNGGCGRQGGVADVVATRIGLVEILAPVEVCRRRSRPCRVRGKGYAGQTRSAQ